jgi:hypothetical protein
MCAPGNEWCKDQSRKKISDVHTLYFEQSQADTEEHDSPGSR